MSHTLVLVISIVSVLLFLATFCWFIEEAHSLYERLKEKKRKND